MGQFENHNVRNIDGEIINSQEFYAMVRYLVDSIILNNPSTLINQGGNIIASIITRRPIIKLTREDKPFGEIIIADIDHHYITYKVKLYRNALSGDVAFQLLDSNWKAKPDDEDCMYSYDEIRIQ